MEQITIFGIKPICTPTDVNLPNFGIDFYAVHSAIKSKCNARFNDTTEDGKVKVFAKDYFYAYNGTSKLSFLDDGSALRIEGKPYLLGRVLMDKHIKALQDFCELNNMVLFGY